MSSPVSLHQSTFSETRLTAEAIQDYSEMSKVQIIYCKLTEASLVAADLEKKLAEKTTECREKQRHARFLKTRADSRHEAWLSRSRARIQAAKDTGDDENVVEAMRVVSMCSGYVVNANYDSKVAKEEYKQAVRELKALRESFDEADMKFKEIQAQLVKMGEERGVHKDMEV
ncbi:hypothetical protein IWX90DRAFT_419458 [Phyllosticta citrichinensis]|uniref:Uncharacterized protein n=1 Tax=Phyllosticta citrichinensis TaxID=1130410 RepID=A0ABR1XEV1_9PEZI